jgi:thioredoxin-like negative regulator of GroEL
VRGDADQDPRKKAFEAYDREDFQEANQLFSALYTSTGDPIIAFYLGVSYMELKNFEGAMEAFSQVNNQEANYFWEARWYTALCMVQTDRPEAAKQILQQIQSSGHFLEKKAEELLLRLP